MSSVTTSTVFVYRFGKLRCGAGHCRQPFFENRSGPEKKYSDLPRQVARCPMFDGIWSRLILVFLLPLMTKGKQKLKFLEPQVEDMFHWMGVCYLLQVVRRMDIWYMLNITSDGYNPWKHSTFPTLCQQPGKNELITRELLPMYGIYIYTLVSTYVYHNNQPHVGKYTGPYMDPMGLYLAAIPLFCLYFFSKVTVLLNRICWWKALSGVLLECEDLDPRKRTNVPWKGAYFKRNVISNHLFIFNG